MAFPLAVYSLFQFAFGFRARGVIASFIPSPRFQRRKRKKAVSLSEKGTACYCFRIHFLDMTKERNYRLLAKKWFTAKHFCQVLSCELP